MASSRLKQSWGGAVLWIARRFLSPQVKSSEGTPGTWSRIVAAAGERCLSLMEISGPYEDTLNSEAGGGGRIGTRSRGFCALTGGSFSREALLILPGLTGQ